MKTKSILSTLFLAAFFISSFGATYHGTNEYSESGLANANNYNFRGTYSLTGTTAAGNYHIGLASENKSYTGTIGSQSERISAKVLEGYDVYGAIIGYITDYAAGRTFSGVYFDEIYAKTTNTVGRWIRGISLRAADFEYVSVNTMHVETTASTGNAVAIGYQSDKNITVINHLDMGVSTVISGTSSGARGINFNGTDTRMGTISGILNVTSNYNGADTGANFFAAGIIAYSTGKTFSIDAIEAQITVKSPNGIAHGIYSQDKSIIANLAKNAFISVQGKDAANSYVLCAESNFVRITGDFVNTQTLKGNVYAKTILHVDAGSYIFDNNFDSATKFTGKEGIMFYDGSKSRFSKSVELSGFDVTFYSGSTVILDALSTTNYSMISSDSANITSPFGANLELLILGDFEANDGDTMRLIDASSISSDNFTFAIKTLSGDTIDESLYSYADGLVSFHGNVVVPEASEIAAVFGVVALSFAMLRRRKSAVSVS